MSNWEYEVSGYYGPSGRKGSRKNPNLNRPGEREGGLAGSVGLNGIGMMQAEVSAFMSREDIGEIIVTGPHALILCRLPDGTWPEWRP